MVKAKNPINDRGATKRELKKLTPQQLAFVNELVASPNFSLKEAAEKAGYATPNTMGSKLMANPIISRAVGKAIRDRMVRCELTADRVVQELMSIAFFNPQDMLDGEGNMYDLKDMDPKVARNIQRFKARSVEVDGQTTTAYDITFQDKLRALELLAKHLGMLNDRLIPEKDENEMQSKDIIAMLLDLLGQKTPSNVITGNFIEAKATEHAET